MRKPPSFGCKELDLMVEIARTIGRSGGVIGARMTGGGFGGSTVTLCESGKVEQIAATLAREYKNPPASSRRSWLRGRHRGRICSEFRVPPRHL